MMSREQLLEKARQQKYKPEVLEKVYRLLDTLNQIAQIPFLKECFVLKGGTALNLFCFDTVPRLSVDIDLNYIRQLNREKMLEERPIIREALSELLTKNQFTLHRNPGHHAGGKMVWRYPSVLGQFGNLEIDLNYMYRQPLFEPVVSKPAISTSSDFKFPVLDVHELAAGKLSALMNRTASRDLFDSHYLLTKCQLDNDKLRLAFVTYMAMTNLPLESLEINHVKYDQKELHNRLLPVLQQASFPRSNLHLKEWSNQLIDELKLALKAVLPLHENEQEFLRAIRQFKEVKPELITNNVTIQEHIKCHPGILWSMKR